MRRDTLDIHNQTLVNMIYMRPPRMSLQAEIGIIFLLEQKETPIGKVATPLAGALHRDDRNSVMFGCVEPGASS